MKKTLKIILGVVTALGILVIIAAVYIFNQLPSVSSIASSIKHKKNNQEQVAATEVKTTSADVASTDVTVQTEREKTEHTRLNQLMLDDLMSVEKPLSDFCGSLKNAKVGKLNQKDFGNALVLSVGEDTKDPRIQAAKPMLRYLMRLPKMTDMIHEAEAADERNEEGFFKKAEFYAKAASAFSEMKEHKSDIESVMDRSYLLLGLNKLIASKPNLLEDIRVQNYCNGVELSFNQSNTVDYESEKTEFLNFLNDVDVKPKDIGFDPEYKSDIQFKFSDKAMTFEGGWLSELFQSDTQIDVDSKSQVN